MAKAKSMFGFSDQVFRPT